MRWYELRAEAVEALPAGDWPRVRALAEQMAELDGGTSPVPGFLLGRAYQAAGEPAVSAAPAGRADVSSQALAAARKAATRARVTVARARAPGAAC